MANRRIEDKHNHDAKLGVRLTQEEHSRLKLEAKNNGVTVSQIIRARVTGTKIHSKADSIAIATLNKQGGLLKHLLMEAEGAHIYRKQINHLLEEIELTIKRIAS